MTPEEALPVVQHVAGVKRAKVLAERKSNPERRLDIDYVTSNIGIADLPFELGPRFENGRLAQVLLAARKQCGVQAMRVFERLASGLNDKYGDLGIAAPQLSDRDFREAERKSLTSAQPADLTATFANSEVAVMLTFRMTVEAPLPPPTSFNRLEHSLWQLASLQYEQRKDECEGTGDRRMDVVLIYLPRSVFDAALNETMAAERAKAEHTADQL